MPEHQSLVADKLERSKKLVFIYYLRVFCILYVVGYWHIFDYTNTFPGYYNFFTKSVTEIVLGLFVISAGFLAGKSSNKSTTKFDFYVKRLVRIYPLYFIATFLFYVFKIDSGLTLFKSLAFVSMFDTPAPLTLWFINMIMIFYLVTPFLNSLANNLSLKKYLFCIIFVIALLVAFYFFAHTLDGRLLMYLPCFAVGLYYAVNSVQTTFIKTKNLGIILIIVFLIYSIFIVKNTTMDISDVYTTVQHPIISSLIKTPFIVICSYLVFMLSYQARDTFIDIKVIEFISYSSYTMYLFHRPIFTILKFLYFPDNGTLQILYLMTFCLVVTTIVSWSMQRLYDGIYRTQLRPFFSQ